MAKGDSLKRYKADQKEQTRKKIEEAIVRLKKSETGKISVAKLAQEVGVTRATLYANYQDLLLELNTQTKQTNQKIRDDVKDKNETIRKLKKENQELKSSNALLMDQVVALKKMLNKS